MNGCGVLAAVSEAFFSAPTAEDVGALLARLGLAFALGLGVAVLHARQRTRRGGTPLTGSLVVLPPLIALVVWSIGGDVARAFGLVGILAIVRFRTIVRDPLDAVHVLFAVAAGVTTAAAGSWVPPVVGCGAIGLGLTVLNLVGTNRGVGAAPRRLRVRLATGALPELERRLAEGGFRSVRRLGLSALKGGGVVEARYEVTAADPAAVDRFALDLSQTEGVHTAHSFAPRG